MKKIKKLLFFYKTLPILKKFLLAPLVGLILVIPFYIFIYFIIFEIKQDVNIANKESLPFYETSHNNILLLEKIVNDINSAVSAKEVAWIDDSAKNADKIRENLNKYINSSYKQEVKEAIGAFNNYYQTAKDISKKIIQNNSNYKEIATDTRLLVQNYNTAHDLLKTLKSTAQKNIENNINSLYNNTSYILSKGNQIFFIWFLASAIIIVLVYNDIGYRIKEIVKSSKEIARGDVDFQKRLCTVSYDELGQIVRSINIFINKLHKNHEQLSLAKKELDALYITDRLTNVYNRIKIDEIIDIELKRKNKEENIFSVILIDIDNFKQVNDNYGHLIGDVLLKEFAAILKNSIRDEDFAGRWGGEEFIIVCLQTDYQDALLLAETLRGKIEDYNFTAIGKMTASFGVSTCRYNDNEESIINNADKALYKAKKSGRNKVVGSASP